MDFEASKWDVHGSTLPSDAGLLTLHLHTA
jgi:hypothetical protein